MISNGAIAAEVTVDRIQDSCRISTRRTNPLSQHRHRRRNSGREKRPQFRGPPARYFKPTSGDLFRLEMSFSAYDGERLYGLGQQQHGLLDQKGCVIDLLQRNTEVTIPFLISSRGYGFLWNNPAVGRVELGTTARAGWLRPPASSTTGSPSVTLRQRSWRHYVDATGHPPLLPEWAAGFWQSKLRYRTQEELLAVAREHKRRGLPLSVIVSDYFHWTLQGDWQFDPEAWPDPAGMVRELEEMGVKLMVSIWPTVNPRSHNYRGDVAARSAGAQRARPAGAQALQRHQARGARLRAVLRRHPPRGPPLHLAAGARQLLPARDPHLVAGCLRAGPLPQ